MSRLKQKINQRYLAFYFLTALFIFTIYIKHTISLQYFILFFMILTLVFIAKKEKYHRYAMFFSKIKISMIFLFLLSSWILLQPIITSRGYHLTEISNQFFSPLIYLFVGMCIAILLPKRSQKIIINIVFFVGFSHLIILLTMAGYHFLQSGVIPIRKVYILPVDEISYLTNLIYSMFLAEIYTRFKYNQKYLYLSNFAIPFIFLTFVIAIYLEGMRWGVVTFSLTTITFILFYLLTSHHPKFQKFVLFSITTIFLIALVLGNLKSDKRWDSISETINISLYSPSLYWLNPTKFPCPKLSNGQCVNMSNYIRLAQQVHGYKTLLDYPLGIGYSRYAYKNMMDEKYNNQEGGFNFPHSGVLNLIIGIGIPGFILYVAFTLSLLYLLLKLSPSFSQIFTIFFIFAYNTRGIIDMTFMNHSLKVFFFLMGLGIGTAIFFNQQETTHEK
ncbi:O-antigen ligase family protein [Sulfurospirillum sp. 1612]|uniref:O-antigen ligase family protein n=1 Tax=Sulfurospirillum sp. 1612 TaxID=3094835 RepID=UPI002F91E30D